MREHRTTRDMSPPGRLRSPARGPKPLRGADWRIIAPIVFAAPCVYAADRMNRRCCVTLTIELPDEQRAALAAKARAQGLSAEEYARQVLQQDLAPEWLQKSWETSKQAGLD